MLAGQLPLSKDVEKAIVQCIQARAEMEYPVDKMELLEMVQDNVCQQNIKTPFKNGRPDEDCYNGFMKRAAVLSLKKPERLQKSRKINRKPDIVFNFDEILERVMDENSLKDDSKAAFVFNADESGFNSDPKKVRAIGVKGKPLNRVSGGSGKQSTAVLACISADGKALPPLIAFKGAAVQARWFSEGALEGTLYAASKNGWMEEPQFFHWFKEGFLTHVKQLRESTGQEDQTAILIYDGHKSHVSVRTVDLALGNNIVLLKLPSHLSDKLQPLDKGVFGSFKNEWDAKLVSYGKSQMSKASGHLPKEMFAQLLSEV